MMSIKEFFYWLVTVVSGRPVDMERISVVEENAEPGHQVEVGAPLDIFSGMTKAQLLKYAEVEGIEVKKSWTKSKIVDTICAK